MVDPSALGFSYPQPASRLAPLTPPLHLLPTPPESQNIHEANARSTGVDILDDKNTGDDQDDSRHITGVKSVDKNDSNDDEVNDGSDELPDCNTEGECERHQRHPQQVLLRQDEQPRFVTNIPDLQKSPFHYKVEGTASREKRIKREERLSKMKPPPDPPHDFQVRRRRGGLGARENEAGVGKACDASYMWN